jgi:competence protein ComEC
MLFWRLKARRHASDVLVALAVGLVLGVALSFALRTTFFTSIAWLGVAALLLVMAFANCNNLALGLALLAGVLLGCFRTNFTLLDIKSVTRFSSQVVTVSGKVFEDPDISSDGTFAIKLNGLVLDGRALSGNIYVGKLGKQDIKRGDEVTVKGALADGFGSFSAAMWRPQVVEVTRPSPGDLARQVRDWFGGLVRQVIGEPEADLGLGYLLGQRRSLSDHMVEILKITGLTHIVVASGYNLTVLVRFSRRLFMKISRFAALFAALVLVVCFIMVTGVSPSMLRAGLVSILSLLAWYYGRKFHPVSLLMLVAATTLLLSPSYIFDLGWLLSFTSFAGVMILAPLLQAYFFGKKARPNFLVQILFETVSAQLVTMPILVYMFSQISLVSIVANLLVLPTIPLVMLLTFLTGVFALLPAIAQCLGWLASILLGYHLQVMEYLGSLKWAIASVNLGVLGVVVCYVLVAVACVYLSRATGYQLRQANVVE